ncbi:MAG: MATE family efflux transporter [Duncaniella sp.]|nr:MATE family efflux transporter [Duncaniella sp.]
MAQTLSETARLNELSVAPVGRLLLRYSLPAVTGMLVMSLYNIIGRIFIGQVVGPDAIAGLAITFPVMNLEAALGVLIGAGGSARISILLGQKRLDEANKVLANSLVLLTVLITLYLGTFTLFIDPILRAFGASARTLPYAREYMLYVLPGVALTSYAFTFNNFMRASGYPVKAMITMFIGAGINVALVPLFIYVFRMGIKGAALATDASMAVSALFVMAHFLRRNSIVRFHRNASLFRPDLSIVVSIVTIGAAPSLVNAASCFINVIINKSLYIYGGDTAVAAAGVFVSFTSLLAMFVVGICQGMQPIVGYNYGAGKIHRLKRAYLLAVAAGSVVAISGQLVGHFFPYYIARAFTKDAELISQTVTCLSIVMSAFCFVGFQIVTTNYFQSIGRASIAIVLSLSRQVIFLIPLLLILPSRYGLNGVWASFPIADLMATLVTAVLIGREFSHLAQVSLDSQN